MPEVFEIVNPEAPGGIVLLCDHASNHIPPEYDNLGIDADLLGDHIAWDIGAAAVALKMSALVGATAVLARFSRLLIDTNRHEDAETLIPIVSDDNAIPGNTSPGDVGQGGDERQIRLARFYRPFHAACRMSVMRAVDNHPQPLVLGIHSFTPQLNGGPARPWDVSVMWNDDDRLAMAMANAFAAEGLVVGHNEPYSGSEWMHSVTEHARPHGLPNVQIEIRQDLVTKPEDEALWALRLTAAVGGARAGGKLD